MIPKLSSQQLNQAIATAQESISAIDKATNTLRLEVAGRLRILRTEGEWLESEETAINLLLTGSGDTTDLKNRVIFGASTGLYGRYEKFGTTVHAKITGTATDIFNFSAPNATLFRNNMKITVNGTEYSEAKNWLMADTVIGKKPYMMLLDTPMVTVKIEMQSGVLTGDLSASIIEMAPLFAGSNRLISVQIWDTDDAAAGITTPRVDWTDLGRTETSRLLLPKSLSVKKIRLGFYVDFKTTANLYPFGFRRLSFLRCAFDSNSYVVATLARNNYIDWISNAIIIRSQKGRAETTCTDKGIKLYAGVTEEGVLEHEITTSSATSPVSLARNIKTFYAKVPLTDASLKSLEFLNIENR